MSGMLRGFKIENFILLGALFGLRRFVSAHTTCKQMRSAIATIQQV